MKIDIHHDLKNLNLWIIDDEEAIRETIALHLSDHFTVKTYSSAYAAWNDILAEPKSLPDMILTDMRVPKMTGLQLLENLRMKNLHTPVIIMSAYTDKEVLISSINNRIGGFLEKPFDFDIALKKLISAGHLTLQAKAYSLSLGKVVDLKYAYEEMFKHYFDRYHELYTLLESANLTQDLSPSEWLRRLHFEREQTKKIETLESEIKALKIALERPKNNSSLRAPKESAASRRLKA